MEKTTKRWIVLGSIAAVALVLLASGVSAYNDLNAKAQAADAQSKIVDVQYQRAFRLLGPLTELAQQYLKNETEIQAKVASLRSGQQAATSGNLSAQDRYSQQVMETGNLVIRVVNERYPELRGVQLFANVQTETINTENKIATEKVRYNDRVQAYNTQLKKCCFPILAASFFGFEPKEYIGYDARPNQSTFPTGTPL